MDRIVFYILAALIHAVFIGALFAIQEFDYLRASLEFASAIKWLAYLLASLAAIFFYANVDYFFVSFRLHRILVARKNMGHELGAMKFYFLKVISWVYVIGFPLVALAFASIVPLVINVYMAMFFVLSLGVLSGFMFRSYLQYRTLRQSDKWGVLAIW